MLVEKSYNPIKPMQLSWRNLVWVGLFVAYRSIEKRRAWFRCRYQRRHE
ncbi:MAG: hypothetical protein QOH31_4473 [Verrucomicrobiota bacterium]